jgi:hypothetical protein
MQLTERNYGATRVVGRFYYALCRNLFIFDRLVPNVHPRPFGSTELVLRCRLRRHARLFNAWFC